MQAAIDIEPRSVLQEHATRAEIGQVHEPLARGLHHGVENLLAIDGRTPVHRGDGVFRFRAEERPAVRSRLLSALLTRSAEECSLLLPASALRMASSAADSNWLPSARMASSRPSGPSPARRLCLWIVLPNEKAHGGCLLLLVVQLMDCCCLSMESGVNARLPLTGWPEAASMASRTSSRLPVC